MKQFEVLRSYDLDSPIIPSKIIIMEVTLSGVELEKYNKLDNKLRKNLDTELIQDLMSDCNLSYSNDVLCATNWNDIDYALVLINRMLGEL